MPTGLPGAGCGAREPRPRPRPDATSRRRRGGRRGARAALAAAVTLVALSARAGAQESPSDPATLQSQQADAAAQLDAATASNEQLVAALTVLGQQVETLVARGNEAQRAYEDADRRLREINTELTEIHNDIGGAENRLRQVAVRLYVSPERDDSSMRLLKANTIDEAQQRKIFAETVVGSTREEVEHFRTARQRATQLEEQAAAARADSEAGHAEQRRLFTELVVEARAQQRLQDEWNKRVAAVKPGKDDIDVDDLGAAIAGQRTFTSTAAPAPAGRLLRPVDAPTGDRFGMRNGQPHNGVDFPSPTGTPVKAALGGRVILAYSGGGYNGGYGNVIYVQHSNGMETRYAHLSRVNVSVGADVVQGQVIGLVGTTGRSTGPHLHFETIVNGVFRDPLNYL